MNKKKGGLLLSLRKDMNRRAISDRRLEAIFRTLSRHPYIVAAFICLALTGFGSYSYKFLNGVIVCGVFMIIELFYLRRFLKQLDARHVPASAALLAGCFYSGVVPSWQYPGRIDQLPRLPGQNLMEGSFIRRVSRSKR